MYTDEKEVNKIISEKGIVNIIEDMNNEMFLNLHLNKLDDILNTLTYHDLLVLHTDLTISFYYYDYTKIVSKKDFESVPLKNKKEIEKILSIILKDIYLKPKILEKVKDTMIGTIENFTQTLRMISKNLTSERLEKIINFYNDILDIL